MSGAARPNRSRRPLPHPPTQQRNTHKKPKNRRAGIVGTSLSNGLLEMRKALDPAFVSQNAAPSVLGNAACWSLHMGLSSNLRYQILGGADVVRSAGRLF